MRLSSSMTLDWYEHNLFTVTHINVQIGVHWTFYLGRSFTHLILSSNCSIVCIYYMTVNDLKFVDISHLNFMVFLIN